MMDENRFSALKSLLVQNEKLMGSIPASVEMQDEEMRLKLRKAMHIQLVVRYAIRLAEKAEAELLEQLDRIVGEGNG